MKEIEKIKLVKGSNSDPDIFESIIKSAQAFLKYPDFKQSTRIVYECCKSLLGATAGYMALLSDDESQNELLFLDMGDMPCELNPNLPMPIRGLREKAYSGRKAIYENNFMESEWLQFLPKGHGKLDNVLFAPLVVNNKAVGLFGFANKPGGFSQEDILVARTFAELAAVGLLQNRTLQRYETSARKLNTLMQTAHDAIIIVDQKGKVFFWNRAAEILFGYKSDKMMGKSCIRIIPQKSRKAYREAFARVVKKNIAFPAGQHLEVEGLRKNKEIFPAELSVSQWEVDGTIFFTGIVHDISLRKKIEEKNRRAQKRLQEIFRMMKGGGGIYKAVDDGEDFIILEFHKPPGHAEANGQSDNLAGRRFLDVFSSSPDSGLLKVFKRVWETGKPENYPLTIYDGDEIRAWRSNYVFKLSTGEIVALNEDITERKQIEKTLLESEYLFRSIFETSPCPINLNRLEDGKFILVNQKFLELTGYKESEVVGRTAVDIEIWNDLNKRNEFFSLLLDKWQVNDFEAQFKCKDGRILTALVSAKLLSFRNKQHLLAVTNDITELKKVQWDLREALQELETRYFASTEKLQESEVKYSSLVESLLTGVHMCEDGRISFVNKQFSQMFEYRKDELLGKNIIDLIHPEDRGIYYSFASDTNEGDGYEIRGITKNGGIICLFGKNRVIEINDRQISLGNFANISILKNAEKKRQRAEEELRELSAQLLSAEERERKRIARDIHDSIGQSLSAIKYSVESALLSIDNQSFTEARDALEKVVPLGQQSIDEVRRIIMDLRPSMLDDLGLIATISWFCRDFEAVFENISIKKDIQVEEDDISVHLKTVIYRIVQEALNNAAKYSKADCIFLKLLKTGKNLELVVEDKGVGFDMTLVSESHDNRRGMGLASMRERVYLSGGTVKILSAPGCGTRIQIVWPIEDVVEERMPGNNKEQPNKKLTGSGDPGN